MVSMEHDMTARLVQLEGTPLGSPLADPDGFRKRLEHRQMWIEEVRPLIERAFSRLAVEFEYLVGTETYIVRGDIDRTTLEDAVGRIEGVEIVENIEVFEGRRL